MKRLLIYITGASLEQIKARMKQVQHRNDMYNNIIARRTIKIAPKIRHTVTPKEWVEFPNAAQVTAWYNYINTARR